MNVRVKNKKTVSERLFSIALCGLFAALTAAGAQIAIPTPGGVNFTLQLFVIALFSFALNTADALKTVAAYIALGAVGLPVFTGFSGGAAVLAGPTGGFIWGFLPFALLCSLKTRSRAPRFALGLAGLAVCHLSGVAQYCLYKGSVSFAEGIALVSAPFIVKDILLTCAACGAGIPLEAAAARAKNAVCAGRKMSKRERY